MLHPLQRQLGMLRTRAMRLLAVFGLGRVAATAMAGMIILGLVDYLVRYQDLGLRVLSSLALAGILVWNCYRYGYRILTHRLSDAELARRVQHRYPDLGDSLLSAVEFLGQKADDPTAGSAALRRAVIADTTARSETMDFSAALDRRPGLHAALATLFMGLLAAVLIVVDPLACRIAVARLVNPFGSATWPRTTHLKLARPVDQVARGQPFEIEVIDARGAKLPSEVRIHYRIAGVKGTALEETERMRFLAGSMVARRENVSRPFSYRVEGGDDQSLPWIRVQVVEPPLIESLRVLLEPPAYTLWPSRDSDRQIRALRGTRIHFLGQANRPLKSAVLSFQDGRRIAAVLDDERRFHVPGDGVPLLVERSQSYWFTLTDRESSIRQDSDRWEILAVPDNPPSVTIEQPAADAFVTPEATLPLRILAKDDLALKEVAIGFGRSDRPSPSESRLTIYRGPSREKVPVPFSPSAAAASATMAGESRVIEYPWELARLDLRPGTEIAFYATASDYRPGVGRSDLRRLRVITAEELQNRIAGRESLILSELAQALKLQQENRVQVAIPAARLAAAGSLEQSDVDHLQGAALNQRQIDRALTGRGEGVVRHIGSLLEDLDRNKVDSPEVRRRMQGLLAQIARLEKEHLPSIGDELTTAIKAAQVALEEHPAACDATGKRGQAPFVQSTGHRPKVGRAVPAKGDCPLFPADPLVAAALDRAVKHQDQVIASLSQMLGQLSQWDNYRRFYRDVAEMVRQQEELARRALSTARTTLAQDPKDLQPQQVAELSFAARGELELALRLEQLQESLHQAGRQMADSDPLAAGTVADAATEIERRGISAAMRAAMDNLQRNQMGQAIQAQKQILQDLDELLDILAGRRQHELAGLLKSLTETATELNAVAARQAALTAEITRAGQQSDEAGRRHQLDELGGRQATLADEVRRMARHLERLLADRPGQATQQAAGQMDQSAAAARQADAAAANRFAEQARDSLAEALRQLKLRLRQMESDLSGEEISRREAQFTHLSEQQQRLLDETRALHAAATDQRPWPAAALARLEQLAARQQSLQDETLRLRESDRDGPFGLALAGAAADMEQAAGLLRQRQAGSPTQQAQQNTLRRLALALDAMRPEPAAKPEAEGRGGQGSGKQGSTGKQITMAELKLLRSLQQEINRRTRQLDATYGALGAVDAAARREYGDLGRDQGDLADLVGRLLESSAESSPGTRSSSGAKASAAEQPRTENMETSPSPQPLQSADPLDRSLFEPNPQRKPNPPRTGQPQPRELDAEDLSRQPMRELAPAGAAEEEEPLAAVAREMREAQRRIARSESGRRTQAVQQQVVAELDRLVQQARTPGSESQAQPRTASTTERGPIVQPPPPQPPGAKSASPRGGSAGKRSAAGPPPQAAGMAKIRGLLENVWGELPHKQREQMLQTPVEEFLPEYESMLEDYFQRLAAPQEKNRP